MNYRGQVLVAAARQGHRLVHQNVPSMPAQISRESRDSTYRRYSCPPVPQSVYRLHVHAKCPRIFLYSTGTLLAISLARMEDVEEREWTYIGCIFV